MGPQAEVVAEGIHFPEGPVWCPDGALVVTSVSAGALYRIDLAEGRGRLLADTGGGANGAVLASDGGFVVTQNGGIDLRSTGVIPDAPSPRLGRAGLQRVLPDNSVTYLCTDGFHAPNDLAVGPDGTIYFTDPGHFPPPEPSIGRVMAYAPDGTVTTVAEPFWYCNGIALEPSGTLALIEQTGLLRISVDGSEREWIIEELGPGAGDGFCLDADGRFYVASTVEHGIRVVEPDGDVVDFLHIPGDGLTTNCCFGGADGRTLFATDGLPGRVLAFEGMPTPGLAMTPWPVP
ncbi:MAG TPA: SMP-30/gluconolactonase/LRE family protein [Acidimicrobiia bacterium]|nr:SMP-30/gluconolactonase/LRE family protein [Acidimicrobiia bacterium]